MILFLQICEAVQHLHECEDLGGPYAHRDIKPHNVLLREDMFPVLMDLGSVEVARVKIRTHSDAQYLQDMAAERCSMPYRPPELYQVDSKCDIDERTDIWVCSSFSVHFIVFENHLHFEQNELAQSLRLKKMLHACFFKGMPKKSRQSPLY